MKKMETGKPEKIIEITKLRNPKDFKVSSKHRNPVNIHTEHDVNYDTLTNVSYCIEVMKMLQNYG